MSISGIDRNILKPGSRRQVTERVQVSALAATYPAAKALMRAARAATVDQMPTVPGIENVVVGSAFRSAFGDDYGVVQVTGPMRGLMSRAVVVIGADGDVAYTELVPEITTEPNYDAALAALA